MFRGDVQVLQVYVGHVKVFGEALQGVAGLVQGCAFHPLSFLGVFSGRGAPI